MDLSISPRGPMAYLDALFVGAYTLRIVTSSQRTDPFIVRQGPSLSLVTSLALKSAVSEHSIGSAPAFFRLVLAGCVLLHPFTSIYVSYV